MSQHKPVDRNPVADHDCQTAADADIALLKSPVRRRNLQEYVRLHSHPTEPIIILDDEVDTAKVANANSEQPLIKIPAWPIEQRTTDVDADVFLKCIQYAEALHELGHILFTDSEYLFQQVKEAASEPNRLEILKRFANSLEDGGMEEALRHHLGDLARQRLDLKNENYVAPSILEIDATQKQNLDFLTALDITALDLAKVASGAAESLLGGSPDRVGDDWGFVDDTHRDIFEDLYPALEKADRKVKTTPDPRDRADHIRTFLDVVDDAMSAHGMSVQPSDLPSSETSTDDFENQKGKARKEASKLQRNSQQQIRQRQQKSVPSSPSSSSSGDEQEDTDDDSNNSDDDGQENSTDNTDTATGEEGSNTREEPDDTTDSEQDNRSQDLNNTDEGEQPDSDGEASDCDGSPQSDIDEESAGPDTNDPDEPSTSDDGEGSHTESSDEDVDSENEPTSGESPNSEEEPEDTDGSAGQAEDDSTPEALDGGQTTFQQDFDEPDGDSNSGDSAGDAEQSQESDQNEDVGDTGDPQESGRGQTEQEDIEHSDETDQQNGTEEESEDQSANDSPHPSEQNEGGEEQSNGSDTDSSGSYTDPTEPQTADPTDPIEPSKALIEKEETEIESEQSEEDDTNGTVIEAIENIIDQLSEDEEGSTSVQVHNKGSSGGLEAADLKPDNEDQFDPHIYQEAVQKVPQVAHWLEEVLEDNEQGKEIRGLTTGSLDQQNLHSLATGNYNLCKVEIPGDDKEYHVTIILDRSGSMHRCIDSAVDAMVTFALALEALGIDVTVIDFVDDQARVVCPKSLPLGTCRENLATVETGGMTPLTDALELANVEAQMHSEESFIIAITDDNPDDKEAYLDQLEQTPAPVVGLSYLYNHSPGQVPEEYQEMSTYYDAHNFVHDADSMLRGMRRLINSFYF